MRFLLINVPIRLNEPPNAFPTGLGIIAQVLVNEGHDVQVLDANALRIGPDKVVAMARRSGADAIGLSGLISTYAYQNELISALKKALPSTLLISGGGCATAAGDLMMDRTPVDVLVKGDGEHTIAEIAAALSSGHTLHGIDGCVFRDGEEVVANAPREAEANLDVFPMAAYSLFPVDIYLKHPIWHFKEPTMNVIASRGCPLDCRFCYNMFGDRSYRRRGPDAIAEEIRYLKQEYKIRTFAFVDDNLTVKKSHLKEVCERLKREDIVWGCHGRVDTCDDERLSAMAGAGCKWLGFGVESGSPRILKAMRKRITVDKIRNAVIKTRQHGIFVNTTFIHGYPGENLETVQETMRLKLELNLAANSFFATPYPGTELFDLAVERNLIPDVHDFLMSLDNAYDFRINFMDVPAAESISLRERANAENIVSLSLMKGRYTAGQEEKFMAAARSVLAADTLIPESKGAILVGFSRYYASRGDHERAKDYAAQAAEYGVKAGSFAEGVDELRDAIELIGQTPQAPLASTPPKRVPRRLPVVA